MVKPKRIGSFSTNVHISPHLLQCRPTLRFQPCMAAVYVIGTSLQVVAWLVIRRQSIQHFQIHCLKTVPNMYASDIVISLVTTTCLLTFQKSWLATLLAQLCAENGSFFEGPIPKLTPAKPLDETLDNPWAPFEDRLSFDWAQYHYVKLQSSERDINEGLDLWLASIIKNNSDSNSSVPWNSAEELYDTIDSIQAGDTPWKTYKFTYNSPKPDGVVPQWMEQEYELNTCDVLAVVEQQLATSEFDGSFDYTPYQEFGPDGERMWSNLMSGHWAWKEAVSSFNHRILWWPINHLEQYCTKWCRYMWRYAHSGISRKR